MIGSRELATLPLIDQPEAAFHYGRSTDLLGLLIARIEDAPLGDVLQRRMFGPLGSRDTGFTVPRSKRHRRAGTYGFDDEGRLTALPPFREESQYQSVLIMHDLCPGARAFGRHLTTTFASHGCLLAAVLWMACGY